MSSDPRGGGEPAGGYHGSHAYREAGVDLDAAAAAVDLIRSVASGASRPEVVSAVGGFAGLYEIGGGRLFAAATDGVGTKTEIARLAGRLDTIGIDLVAMCADDVVCTGAEPLFFLDYLAVERVIPEEVATIVGGVAEGCRRAGCALLGGETAEHPGVMEHGRFDLAGFCVGVVEEADVLDPSHAREGDALIGLASSGLHSNGYSLVRHALLDSGKFRLEDTPEGLQRPLVDELLEPTAIYAPLVLELVRARVVRSVAHITGGGLEENVPRALPDGLAAQLETSAWEVPPVFDLLQRAAGLTDDEMRSTFNLGLGMVLVTAHGDVDEVIARAEKAGTRSSAVGHVVAGSGVRFTER
ncbi:MAG: phosphoribosylformylglycinamidine cyclo-ligase [Actinomycetota bacterium]|nr:phosphoribosylformylglycinamidine cyclo-ligase [Actinomycetota bacterium]